MRLCLLLLTFFLTAAARAAELSPAETQALLKTLESHRAKFPSFTVDFVEEKTSHLLNRPLISTGTVAFQTPNKFRREITGQSPSFTISNGQKLWIYYPNFKEAELYTLGQKAFFDDSIAALTAGLNFHNIEKFFTVKVSTDGSVHRFQLTPRSSGLKRIVRELAVWVADDAKINRTETILPKGDRVVTIYKNQRPAPLPASTFDFTPPPEAHISQPLGK